MKNLKPKYKRILIKLSGEALAGEAGHGLDENVISRVVDQIKQIHDLGVEIALVIGGGNFWRGRQGKKMDRTTADHMGMLATVMNSLAMMDALEQQGIPTRVQTALIMTSVAEPYILRRALHHFEKGRIVIMACGTGNPYCSTDTAAAQRACEIQADVLMMAKNIDGIYDSDPKVNPSATKYDHINYIDVIKDGIKAMDATAATMCMENNVPVLAFGLDEENSLIKAVCGDKLGTIIDNN
ncbi:MAG: UMP kinase [Clostridia bacterium]|nr:UMP kinase [Clostridia bacterium]